ncbi:hypothetical protein M501DRAFT_85230 [Patellaria atrata CBS 101060]|uniref:Uncharacterized protein n=1 Tax=Patellaria atrata CBS 101060 TaxID=1346257 RepID=A0A9P4SI62_9PEZI|nr:hypothetical protein M501DRAFT_85230 [Patellaria atrata CBS 101060]
MVGTISATSLSARLNSDDRFRHSVPPLQCPQSYHPALSKHEFHRKPSRLSPVRSRTYSPSSASYTSPHDLQWLTGPNEITATFQVHITQSLFSLTSATVRPQFSIQPSAVEAGYFIDFSNSSILVRRWSKAGPPIATGNMHAGYGISEVEMLSPSNPVGGGKYMLISPAAAADKGWQATITSVAGVAASFVGPLHFKSAGLVDSGSSQTSGNWEILDGAGKTVAALMMSSAQRSATKTGRLHFLITPEMDVVDTVITSLMAVIKKTERHVW